MGEHVNVYRAFPAGYQALLALEAANAAGPIDHALYELVKLRASQLNGCAFCIDMHHKDARAAGEIGGAPVPAAGLARGHRLHRRPSGRHWRSPRRSR